MNPVTEKKTPGRPEMIMLVKKPIVMKITVKILGIFE
jgi:hypothetical protein